MITKHPYELVKFEDGKFGVRVINPKYIEFLDKNGESWRSLEYIIIYCHLSEKQARKVFHEAVEKFYERFKPIDFGAPVE